MGMLGKMFDDQNLKDESGEDGAGQRHLPRFDIDLDGGVVRMPTLHPADQPTEDPDPDSDAAH